MTLGPYIWLELQAQCVASWSQIVLSSSHQLFFRDCCSFTSRKLYDFVETLLCFCRSVFAIWIFEISSRRLLRTVKHRGQCQSQHSMILWIRKHSTRQIAWLQKTLPWCFQLSKRHVTTVCQGLSSLASGGGKMRDPRNEVALDQQLVTSLPSVDWLPVYASIKG